MSKSTVALVVKMCGGPAAVGREIGVTSQAVSQWGRVPPKHVLTLSRLANIPPHEIRPDLYESPAPQPAPEAASA